MSNNDSEHILLQKRVIESLLNFIDDGFVVTRIVIEQPPKEAVESNGVEVEWKKSVPGDQIYISIKMERGGVGDDDDDSDPWDE